MKVDNCYCTPSGEGPSKCRHLRTIGQESKLYVLEAALHLTTHSLVTYRLAVRTLIALPAPLMTERNSQILISREDGTCHVFTCRLRNL